MQEQNDYRVSHEKNTTETIKQLVLTKLQMKTKLGSIADTTSSIKSFFEKYRFYTEMRDYRNIHQTFTIVQVIDELIMLVTEVNFTRTAANSQGRVYFKPTFDFKEVVSHKSPFIGLAKINDIDGKTEGGYTPSAFFIDDLKAFQAYTSEQGGELMVAEYTYYLQRQQIPKYYTVPL